MLLTLKLFKVEFLFGDVLIRWSINGNKSLGVSAVSVSTFNLVGLKTLSNSILSFSCEGTSPFSESLYYLNNLHFKKNSLNFGRIEDANNNNFLILLFQFNEGN